ncbi:DUF4439 domain-containing protein [Enemella sp. A6]|uniref:DUF4439 domain-containing protein n=1 Tax=Enemella sp. A6 TaxID=3440152 RepID=UPI003EB6D4D7
MLVSRRTLFAWLGAGTAAALTGCAVSDPRVSEPTEPHWSPTPTPSPTQQPEVQLAVQREAELAARAASIMPIAGAGSKVVTAARDAHQAHVDQFGEHFGPIDPPTTPTPQPAQGLAAAVTAWSEELTAVAAEHRSQALLVSGRLGLFFASCAGFATVLARQGTTFKVPIGSAEPDEFVPISDTDALTLLVEQLHAARYAYQTALGAFQLSDERRTPLEARDRAISTLRDRLSAALVDRGVAPPPAEPAYEVPRPKDPAAAIALTRGVEQRLLPFVGAAVAGVAAGDDLRAVVVDELTATTARLVAAGGGLPRWPGLA